MNEWIIIILPVAGIIIGAFLHYLFTRDLELKKQTRILEMQAYSDYLKSVAAAAHLRSDEDLRDAFRDAADAKSRIAIFGTEDVIKALAKFVSVGEALGAYDTELEAIEETTKEHKLGTFLVQECVPGAESYTQTFHSRVNFG